MNELITELVCLFILFVFLFFFVAPSAECGDYVAEDYPDHTYLSSYKFIPHQDAELEKRIMENHKKHWYVLALNGFQ